MLRKRLNSERRCPLALVEFLSWAPHVGFDLGRWPVIQQYAARIGSRPKVVEAMKAEGLLE